MWEYPQAVELLSRIGQPELLRYWDLLTAEQRKIFLTQLSRLDLSCLSQQQHLLAETFVPPAHITPFDDFALAGNPKDDYTGQELLSRGMMGCLLIAGGQGSRLGFNHPKGMFPVTPIKRKSLFQLCAEKVLAASQQCGRDLLLAVMTSPSNHAETVAFFESHSLFGLKRHQIDFFPQGVLPFLDTAGKLFLENPHVIAEGPDGNGGALHHFYQSGLWEKWATQGIRYLNFILVDNPLAAPFDAELLGYHWRTAKDVIVKCTFRRHAQEKVGLLAKENGQVKVIEYSEIAPAEAMAVNPEGQLLHQCANLSLFSFSMDFIRRTVSSPNYVMPLHKAWKAVKRFNLETAIGANQGMQDFDSQSFAGGGDHSQKVKAPTTANDCGSKDCVPWPDPIAVSRLNLETAIAASHTTILPAWKFEKFIFDLLLCTDSVGALLYPRENCFAPLKNADGEDSLGTVQAALQHNDQRILSKITEIECQASPIELAPAFYYPTAALRRKWQGRVIDQRGYIES